MALADTAKLVASLELQDKFSAPAGRAEKSLGGLEQRFGKIGSAGTKIGGGLTHAAGTVAKLGAVAGAVAVGGGIALLTKAFRDGQASLEQLDQVNRQSAQVIRSTGGAAGQSAADVRKLAEEFENLSTNDDKAIQGAENMLLTFTGIGPKAFKPATQAVIDLNAAMGGGDEGLQKVAIQVGKALNDPIRGITALSRVGVSFTEQQKKQIKTLVQQNDTFGAQQIILRELSKEFGGQGKVFGTGPAADARRLADATEDLSRTFAGTLQPAVGAIRKGLAQAFTDPRVIDGVTNIGKAIAGFVTPDRVTGGINKLAGAFGKLFSQSNLDRASDLADKAFTKLEAVDFGAIAGGLKITADATKGIVNAFLSLPPDLQKIAIAALAANKLSGGLVTSGIGSVVKNLAGLALSSLKTITAGNVTVVGTNVTGPGGGGGPGGIGTAIGIGLIAAGVAEGLREAADFHGQREDLRNQAPTLTNSEALAVQLSKMTEAQRQMAIAHGAANEFLREGTTYAKALQSASEKLSTAAGKTSASVADDRRSEGALSRMAQALPQRVASRIGELSREFITALRTARERNDPFAAHRAAIAGERGAGNVFTTQMLITTLREQRQDARGRGDRQTVKLLDGDISKIGRVLRSREGNAKVLAKADKIIHSNESNGQKIKELKAIEASYGGKNKHVLDTIHTAIEGLKPHLNRVKGATDRVNTNVRTFGAKTERSVDRLDTTTHRTGSTTVRTIQQGAKGTYTRLQEVNTTTRTGLSRVKGSTDRVDRTTHQVVTGTHQVRQSVNTTGAHTSRAVDRVNTTDRSGLRNTATAATTAGNKTATAIRNKKMSVSVRVVESVTNNVSVNGTNVRSNTQTRTAKSFEDTHASGGIARRRRPALVGEFGPEVITPTENLDVSPTDVFRGLLKLPTQLRTSFARFEGIMVDAVKRQAQTMEDVSRMRVRQRATNLRLDLRNNVTATVTHRSVVRADRTARSYSRSYAT